MCTLVTSAHTRTHTHTHANINSTQPDTFSHVTVILRKKSEDKLTANILEG